MYKTGIVSFSSPLNTDLACPYEILHTGFCPSSLVYNSYTNPRTLSFPHLINEETEAEKQ